MFPYHFCSKTSTMSAPALSSDLSLTFYERITVIIKICRTNVYCHASDKWDDVCCTVANHATKCGRLQPECRIWPQVLTLKAFTTLISVSKGEKDKKDKNNLGLTLRSMKHAKQGLQRHLAKCKASRKTWSQSNNWQCYPFLCNNFKSWKKNFW